MRAFHIDLNIANPTRARLEALLRELAALGYDTVVWEVENAVAWRAIAGCETADAFTPREFAAIIAYGRALGLEPIPLLQVLGHAEYVLAVPAFAHLREDPARVDQYCPSHPGTTALIAALIDEYLAAFGAVARFHLGADETPLLGHCPRCRAAARPAAATIWADHVNRVAAPLVARGIEPLAWADMALAHPAALDELAPEVVLCDWFYESRRDVAAVQVWDEDFGHRRLVRGADLPAGFVARYGAWLGPDPARAPDPFYTARFLRARGRRVIGCAASSSYGDNVFAPRTALHLANAWDWFATADALALDGAMLTSWSCHLFPWELQSHLIAAPAGVAAHGADGRAAWRDAFARERFGAGCEGFWDACELLDRRCLLSHTHALGISKVVGPPPIEHATRLVAGLSDDAARVALAEAEERGVDYARAVERFADLARHATRGGELLAWWDWAARNLAQRAQASAFLLRRRLGLPAGDAAALVAGVAALRAESDQRLAQAQQPARRAQVLDGMYRSIAHALGGAGARMTA